MTVCISPRSHIRTEPEEARIRALAEPGDVREPVLRGRIEHAAEPRMRVERKHGHVRVRAREGSGVRSERGVVVEDVLRVFGRDGGSEVVGGAVERRDVEEEVGPAQVVVVRILLRERRFGIWEMSERRACVGWNVRQHRRGNSFPAPRKP